MTAVVGLDFEHFNGMSGEFYLVEIMGAGAALFDYDNDGDLDAYLVQGAMLGSDKTLADALFPPPADLPLKDRLYRNDLVVRPDGARVLRFTDVTEESGIEATRYGMGVAAGDYDGDGWVDLYVTNFGPNQLFRNNGDGTFTEVASATGTDDSLWSVSAAFVDYDHDGWLDLYVVNYVDFSFATSKECYNFTRDYCSPQSYNPLPDRLFHNRGDGTFEDVTATAHVARSYGSGLGVVAADLNGDGRVDIYVANDGLPNTCWINQGDGKFKNTALLAGVALNEQGDAEASMGVDAADVDGDGDEDLFMTHLRGETNTIYLNDGSGLFFDATIKTGLGYPSQPYTGFGTAWFDYDNDGLLDLMVMNGAVTLIEALVEARDPFPLHERNQLFRQTSPGTFEEVSETAGAPFRVSEVSRGAAFGDVDNDGDTDVLLSNNNGPARLLVNNVGNRKHWIGLRLVGGSPPRSIPGTRVAILRAGSDPLWRRARSDGSYASANDPRVLVGLGDTAEIEAVRAIWPDGRVEQWEGLSADRWITLQEGTGREVE